MKIKQTIYFLIIVLGALIMATGDRWLEKEYALSIGIVLLMFGIYKSSQSYGRKEKEKETEE